MDTKYISDKVIAHFINMEEGTASVGDEVYGVVDEKRREYQEKSFSYTSFTQSIKGCTRRTCKSSMIYCFA